MVSDASFVHKLSPIDSRVLDRLKSLLLLSIKETMKIYSTPMFFDISGMKSKS